jgi:hypothetical protein
MLLIMGGLTTHSTRAELAYLSSDNLNACFIASRRVNSSVRFLLNSLAQTIESAILNFVEAEDCLRVDES